MKIIYKNWEITLNATSKPQEVMLELTTNCNLNCIHCFRNSLQENMGFMNRKTVEKVLDEISHVGVEKVSISGWGEPLLHPDIHYILRELKELGVYVILNTNGFYLRNFANDIVSMGIDEVVVSIDSVSSALYGKIRVGGSLDRCLEALTEIRNLKNQHRSGKPLVTLQFTINTLNYKDIPHLVDFATKFGVDKIVLSNVIPINKQHAELACYNYEDCRREAEEMIRELGKHLMFIWNIQFVKSYLVAQQTFSCPFIDRNALFIRWDGKIAPCIHYAHSWNFYFDGIPRSVNAVIFGHIEEGLLEVWRKRNYAEFRFKAEFGYKPSCLDCELRDYCYYTLSNDSDCYGNSPTCAHCPYARGLATCPL